MIKIDSTGMVHETEDCFVNAAIISIEIGKMKYMACEHCGKMTREAEDI